MQAAYLGRVSNKEKQDPSLSIPRQHRVCQAFALENFGSQITKSFWDIESGRKDIELRGSGADGVLFGIDTPRDGGLPELLESVRKGEIDVVVVESIDRLSRSTADSTAIEKELGKYDVRIIATDEPLSFDPSALLLRRVKQGVAEYYVADLLVKSREGMIESVMQGWHPGGPIPYGYLGETHPHPNPIKSADGETKTRLIVCPTRGPVVVLIFKWYCQDGLGLGEIADRLNSDLSLYPAPEPSNRAAKNELAPSWSKSTVQAILRNPKYTGFNVWNRHDKRPGRPTMRPRSEWVWSDQPTHPALVSRELFDQVDEQAKSNKKDVNVPGKRRAPASRERNGRFYATRGRCVCDLCNRRMQGSTQKGLPYVRCLWASGRGEQAAKATGHPSSLQLKEQTVIDEAISFLSTEVFAPEAIARLRGEIEKLAKPVVDDTAATIKTLRSDIDELQQGIDRQVLVFEKYDDPNHPVILAAEKRIEELHNKKTRLEETLAELQAKPAAPAPREQADILETLPDLRPALASLSSEELAELFEAFDLEARYNHVDKTLKLSVTVFPELAAILEAERPLEGAGRSKPSIAGAVYGHISPTEVATASRRFDNSNAGDLTCLPPHGHDAAR